MRVLNITKEYANEKITIDDEFDKIVVILPALLLSIPRGILLRSFLSFIKCTAMEPLLPTVK